jgi:O-methyltransferase
MGDIGHLYLSARRMLKSFVINSGLAPMRRVAYVNGLLELGQWIGAHKNEGQWGFASRDLLYRHINERVLANCDIDYLEFGVFEGASIRDWTSANTGPASRFVGFDSFEGLPEDWECLGQAMPRGAFATRGRLPDIGDSRVRFVKGLFHETLPRFLTGFSPRGRLVVHLDADLYSSTLFVLSTLHPLLVPGTILVFDEFNAVTHEFRAFTDYASSFVRQYQVIGATAAPYQQVAVRLT